jgi:hypothetical protein
VLAAPLEVADGLGLATPSGLVAPLGVADGLGVTVAAT